MHVALELMSVWDGRQLLVPVEARVRATLRRSPAPTLEMRAWGARGTRAPGTRLREPGARAADPREVSRVDVPCRRRRRCARWCGVLRQARAPAPRLSATRRAREHMDGPSTRRVDRV